MMFTHSHTAHNDANTIIAASLARMGLHVAVTLGQSIWEIIVVLHR